MTQISFTVYLIVMSIKKKRLLFLPHKIEKNGGRLGHIIVYIHTHTFDPNNSIVNLMNLVKSNIIIKTY